MSPIEKMAVYSSHQKKLFKICQEYERYFFKQILKSFHETRENQSPAESMFKTMFYESVAGASKTSLGIGEQIFKQMDKKK